MTKKTLVGLFWLSMIMTGSLALRGPGLAGEGVGDDHFVALAEGQVCDVTEEGSGREGEPGDCLEVCVVDLDVGEVDDALHGSQEDDTEGERKDDRTGQVVGLHLLLQLQVVSG